MRAVYGKVPVAQSLGWQERRRYFNALAMCLLHSHYAGDTKEDGIQFTVYLDRGGWPKAVTGRVRFMLLVQERLPGL